MRCRDIFDDEEALRLAFDSFCDDVQQARIKHSIANVAIIVQDACKQGEEVDERIMPCFWGDGSHYSLMLAYTLGQARAEDARRVGLLISGGRGWPPKDLEA